MGIVVDEVREALEKLYDGLALAEVPLAERFPQVAAIVDAPTRAQKLRKVLLDAIELLQPPRPASFRSPLTRSFQVLAMRFLEGSSMAEVADELHISRRQAFRDLALAVEKLAELLDSYPWPTAQTPAPNGAPERDALTEELQHIPLQSNPVDLALLLRAAVRTVQPLAKEYGVSLKCDTPEGTPRVFAGEAVLRQMLVHLLSLCIRSSARHPISVSALAEPQAVALEVRFRMRSLSSTPPQERQAQARVLQLADSQRLSCQVEALPDGSALARIALPTEQRHLVLAVEDNPGALELYRRYLASSERWELVAVSDPRLTFDKARALQPAAIVLDILMPQQDGWSLLQLLRTRPETHHIPVVVCSVFDELELASVLGASAYLKKPVSQFQLLATLERCLGR